jgi:hypothetical protein
MSSPLSLKKTDLNRLKFCVNDKNHLLKPKHSQFAIVFQAKFNLMICRADGMAAIGSRAGKIQDAREVANGLNLAGRHKTDALFTLFSSANAPL